MIALLVVYQSKNSRHMEYERNKDGNLLWFHNHEAALKYCEQVHICQRKDFSQIYELSDGK